MVKILNARHIIKIEKQLHKQANNLWALITRAMYFYSVDFLIF